MTVALFVQILKSLPLLIKVIGEVWEALMRLSRGRPEQLLNEIHSVMQEINSEQTSDERQATARRISLLWAGLPVKGSGLPDSENK